LITGTLASRLMRSIRPLPPRGMITSTYSGIAISRPTAARSVVCDQLHRVGGQAGVHQRGLHQLRQRAVGMQASEPPRRMQALPLLMASDAASMVTLGRLS
jgi:hypothetical protein